MRGGRAVTRLGTVMGPTLSQQAARRDGRRDTPSHASPLSQPSLLPPPPPFSPFSLQNFMKLGHNRRADTAPLDKDRKPVR